MVLQVIFVNVVSLDWVNTQMISHKLIKSGNDFSTDWVNAEMISVYTNSTGKYNNFAQRILLPNTESTQKMVSL